MLPELQDSGLLWASSKTIITIIAILTIITIFTIITIHITTIITIVTFIIVIITTVITCNFMSNLGTFSAALWTSEGHSTLHILLQGPH